MGMVDCLSRHPDGNSSELDNTLIVVQIIGLSRILKPVAKTNSAEEDRKNEIICGTKWKENYVMGKNVQLRNSLTHFEVLIRSKFVLLDTYVQKTAEIVNYITH